LPIQIYHRNQSSGTWKFVQEKVLQNSDVTRNAKTMVSNQSMKNAVARDPQGIGYISIGGIDSSVVPIVLDDIEPTVDNIKSGSYPLVSEIYLIAKEMPEGLSLKFVDFILSPNGRKIAKDQGLIPATW